MPENKPHTAQHKRRGGRFRLILVALASLVLLSGMAGFYLYRRVMQPMVNLNGTNSGHHRGLLIIAKYVYFYIHTGSGFSAVVDSLTRLHYIDRPADFEWLARLKHYDEKVRPGRYRLTDGMSNNALVNLLRSGMQEPVNVVIQNVNTAAELAGRAGRRLEADSAALAAVIFDPSYLKERGLTRATALALFIPDTYECYWNTSASGFMEKMEKARDRFWNTARKGKAAGLGLNVAQVVTLASIVEKETAKDREKPAIAGVYLNRLRIGMPLQADPTVIFAWKDYSIRRVTGVHTSLKSPYNTYQNTGLPPGPICLPSVASIDAVLNADRHNYLYFCAKEDLSGYHNFAANLDEHSRNAKKYQRALNKLNIR